MFALSCQSARTQIEHLILKSAPEKYEEAKRKNFNVVLLIFRGCLNNYLADVVSMAAITPGRRALHYQWGQQSVPCLHWGDNTQTPNSFNQPSGFLSNRKDSQIKSSCSACPSPCAALGSHRKQTQGRTELLIQLHALFGGRTSFYDCEDLCRQSVESLILNSATQRPAGHIFNSFIFLKERYHCSNFILTDWALNRGTGGCEGPPCWFNRLMAELWHKSSVFLLNWDTKLRLLSHGLLANMS